MKGVMYQCLYDIDDIKHPYTAFNQDGSLCGFQNPPVRNFNLGVWIDSVTGGPGDLLLYERWDQSFRETKFFKNCHDPKINRHKREKQ